SATRSATRSPPAPGRCGPTPGCSTPPSSRGRWCRCGSARWSGTTGPSSTTSWRRTATGWRRCWTSSARWSSWPFGPATTRTPSSRPSWPPTRRSPASTRASPASTPRPRTTSASSSGSASARPSRPVAPPTRPSCWPPSRTWPPTSASATSSTPTRCSTPRSSSTGPTCPPSTGRCGRPRRRTRRWPSATSGPCRRTRSPTPSWRGDAVGLLLGLLTLPVSGPVRGTIWVAEQVQAAAERSWYDEGAVRRELAELDDRHEAGEIGDEEYEEAADALIDRLLAAAAREEGEDLAGDEVAVEEVGADEVAVGEEGGDG